MSEDQEWSQRVLRAGYALVYEPRAVVRHSHPYTLRQAFQRFFDSGVSAERAYLAGAAPSQAVLRRRAVDYVRLELGWLWRTRQRRWIPYAVAYQGAKGLGLLLGTHWRRLPAALRPRLSAVKSYWAAPS